MKRFIILKKPGKEDYERKGGPLRSSELMYGEIKENVVAVF